jgi:predicted N-acetyltransferase YhbS
MAAVAPPKLTAPSPLRPAHNVSAFNCGEPSLNLWLEKHALVAVGSRTANTFVVCRGRKVVGYFSIANGAVDHNKTTAKVRRNTPDPIPATILARLAVDNAEKGHGLGRDLLIDANRRILLAAKHSAARLLIVHPLTDTAAAFYEKYGFRSLRGDTTAMFITLNTLADGL